MTFEPVTAAWQYCSDEKSLFSKHMDLTQPLRMKSLLLVAVTTAAPLLDELPT